MCRWSSALTSQPLLQHDVGCHPPAPAGDLPQRVKLGCLRRRRAARKPVRSGRCSGAKGCNIPASHDLASRRAARELAGLSAAPGPEAHAARPACEADHGAGTAARQDDGPRRARGSHCGGPKKSGSRCWDGNPARTDASTERTLMETIRIHGPAAASRRCVARSRSRPRPYYRQQRPGSTPPDRDAPRRARLTARGTGDGARPVACAALLWISRARRSTPPCSTKAPITARCAPCTVCCPRPTKSASGGAQVRHTALCRARGYSRRARTSSGAGIHADSKARRRGPGRGTNCTSCSTCSVATWWGEWWRCGNPRRSPSDSSPPCCERDKGFSGGNSPSMADRGSSMTSKPVAPLLLRRSWRDETPLATAGVQRQPILRGPVQNAQIPARLS